ncbi:hypothetical protein GCM10009867_25230 [Pedococcus aerophilus]|uniref:Uncharacterized protein n=1 Tax=Pedococcus aerophilus TaxID=436356 RepID=A0ABP6HA83_9MICO
MTDFLESVRPVEPTPLTGTEAPVEAGEPSVRQLLAELAHLEDVVRAAGSSVDDPEVLAALAREQVIIDELHRRNP